MQTAVGAGVERSTIWRNRTFLLLWIGSFISTLGDGIYSIGFPLYLLQADPTQTVGAGVVFAVPALLGTLWLPFAGVFADRWDRRRVMLVADLVRAAGLGVGLLLLWQGNLGVGGLTLLACVLSLAGSFFRPASQATRRTVVRDQELTQAQALQRLTQRGALLATAAGGAIVMWLGFGWSIALDAVSFLLSAVFISMVRYESAPTRKVPKGPKGFWLDFKEGLQYVCSKQVVLMIMLLAALLNFAIGPVDVLLVSQALGALKLNAAQTGILDATISVGVIAGLGLLAVFGNRIRLTGWAMLGCLMATACSLIFFGLTTWYPAALLLIAVTGGSMAVGNALIWSIVDRLVPKEMQGRVRSVIGTVAEALTPVGIMVGSWAAHVATTGLVITFAGCGMLVVTLLTTAPRTLRGTTAWERSS